MPDYKEVIDVVEVPPNTGLDGFIHTIRTLLRKPRVQELKIDARGKVTCRRYALENDTHKNVGVDFTDLQPAGIVRNTHIDEVTVREGANAAIVLGGLLDMAAVAQLKPLAFVTGADSVLWEWYRVTTGVQLKNREYLHGFQLLQDRDVPDTALLLMSGYGRDAALVDARTTFKIEMPQFTYQDAGVEVMV